MDISLQGHRSGAGLLLHLSLASRRERGVRSGVRDEGRRPEVFMRLGIGEIVVVLALALLFFGPSKLPQLGNSLGQAIKSFKKGLSSLHDDVEAEPAPQQQTKGLADKIEDGAASKANAVASRGQGSDSAS